MTRAEIRRRVEDHIETLIAALDLFDGNPDDEIEPDLEPDTDQDVNSTTLQWADRVPVKRITMRRVA